MSRKVPFFDESIKLSPNIELVYLDNPYSSPDSTGLTQLAQIHRSLIINKKIWYEISLLTDSNGDKLNSNDKILIQNIISFRKYRTIKNRKFYYLGDEIIATTFANNKIGNKNPLESASRSALGSGIYGLNLSNISEARALSIDNELIYEIDVLKALDVQDKEHGESITIASLLTNRYLDKIISRNDIIDISDVVKNDNIENLVILWNIVFYRNKRYISYEKLENILSNYLTRYLTNHKLIDKNDNMTLIALPINYIMEEMGYTGLIADDLYNNGWDRGCVSYNFNKFDILSEGKAFY
jgi:hypothetical protein